MKTLSGILLLFLLTTCTTASNDSEMEKLTIQVKELEKQLIECQNGENQIIDQVIAMYHTGNYDSVRILYAELQKKYPELHELKEAMDIHYEVLQEETASIREITAREEAYKRAIQKLEVEQEGNSKIYTNALFTHYNNRNMMSIYILKKENRSPSLMIKLSYKGNGWIHFKKASLAFDNRSIEVPFDTFEHKESKKDAGVAEWIEAPISNRMVSFLRSFAGSVNAKMQLTGKHTESRTLTPKERQAIIDVLNGYEALIASN